jgi:hypothetical protein
MAVASNSYPSAASYENDTRREKNNRNLFHAHMISLITMRQRVVLDSGKFKEGRLSGAPCGSSKAAAPCSFRNLQFYRVD